MGKAVVMTAMCKCSFGMAPSSLMVLPIPGQPVTLAENFLMANIMDNKPMVNIMPFGMCQSLTNPTVAAATTAAQGVLTPMPCVPVTTAPWVPGSVTVLVRGAPALNETSKLMCSWGGTIEVTNSGTTKTKIP